MEAKKFRDMSSDELFQKEKTYKKELFELNHQRKIGAVEKPSRFGALRKDIARIHTILKERELKK